MNPDGFRVVRIKEPVDRFDVVAKNSFAFNGAETDKSILRFRNVGAHRKYAQDRIRDVIFPADGIIINDTDFAYDEHFRRVLAKRDPADYFNGKSDQELVFAQDGEASKPSRKISSEDISTGLETVTGIISAIAGRQRNETKMRIKAVCGRRPLRRKNREKWQKCVDDINRPKPEPYRYKPAMGAGAYIAIGLGIVTIGGLAIWAISRAKRTPAPAVAAA